MDSLKSLIGQLPIATMVCSREGEILAANPGFTALTGLCPEAQAQLSVFRLAHATHREAIAHFLREASPSGGETLTLDVLGADGHPRLVELRGMALCPGHQEALLIQMVEIPHLRAARLERMESERFLNHIISSIRGMVYRCRNDQDWTMEYVSPQCLEITGYRADELLNNAGIPFNSIIHPDHRERLWEKWQHLLPDQGVFVDEYPIVTASGAIKWVLEQGGGIFSPQGQLLHLEGIIIDITERKLVEEELSQSRQRLMLQNEEYLAVNEELTKTNLRIQEMNTDLLAAKARAEESERLKSAFLSNMSHEIRTPMNGILGFSQLLLNDSLSRAERGEFVGIVQNCGNQLLAIINDLIDISKIEANLITLAPSAVHINRLLNELFVLFRGKAEAAGLSFTYSAALSNAQCEVWADGTRLRQVISNLLSNALKFTRQGHIKFGYACRNDSLEFFVEDSGVGIPADKQELIFDRFRQVESELSRQVGGTGLGLTISKALVKKMGGSIWVQSEPYFGSTFFFTIPYAKPVERATPQEPRVDPRPLDPDVPLSILVAEDNEINYIYIKELLADLQPKLTWVTNGLEAVNAVDRNPDFDCILMDIKMPVMDGYEATRRIKQKHKHIPIIAQTAYSFSSDRENALLAGCDAYIAKPIDREQFMELMLKFIRVR